MNEQTKNNDVDLEASAEASLSAVQETMDRFLEVADVKSVYGQPVEHGDTIVIPAAEVLCGMAFGAGYGYGKSNDPEEQNQGSGGGGGGGGRTFSRPVAVIIASPEGVRIDPVIDITKLGLAGLTALGFMLSVLARMSKHSSD